MGGTDKAAAPGGDTASGRPSRAERDGRLHPMALFRYGVYVSLGVLAVLTAAAG